MPALRLQRIFFYVGAFKRHIGVYPPVTGDQAVLSEVKPYANAKGNLQFQLDEVVPYQLIARVAAVLALEYRS